MKSHFVMAACLAALSPAFARCPDQFQFARTYKEGTATRSMVSIELPGGLGAVTAHITSKVLSVSGGKAKVSYDITHIDGPIQATEATPPLTSDQGPIGIADSATIRNGQEFIVFLGIAGITPNQTVSVGSTVTAHWAGSNGDVKVDGKGKIEKVSSDGTLLTVTWGLTMTPSYTNSGAWHLTSVYRTSDFSLDHSEGTLGVGEYAMHVKIGVEK